MEKSIRTTVSGKLPNGVNITLEFEFVQVPAKGDILEVASLLEGDEADDYRLSLTTQHPSASDTEPNPAAFVTVKDVYWANGRSYHHGDNDRPKNVLYPIVII